MRQLVQSRAIVRFRRRGRGGADEGVAWGKLNAVRRVLNLDCSGKFAFQLDWLERVIRPPSCDTAQCPWKITSLE